MYLLVQAYAVANHNHRIGIEPNYRLRSVGIGCRCDGTNVRTESWRSIGPIDDESHSNPVALLKRRREVKLYFYLIRVRRGYSRVTSNLSISMAMSRWSRNWRDWPLSSYFGTKKIRHVPWRVVPLQLILEIQFLSLFKLKLKIDKMANHLLLLAMIRYSNGACCKCVNWA